MHVFSDYITDSCTIRLINGETEDLPAGAMVKFVSREYWPRHIEEEFHLFDSSMVVVYSQFGMGFIPEYFLNRGVK